MVGARTHRDHGTASGALGVAGELPRDPGRLLRRDGRDRLLPGRGVRLARVLVRGGPGARKPGTSDAVLGEHQVEDGGDRPTADPAHGYAAQHGRVYLPTYLKTGYGLTQADAANRMAGFVLLAVVMRPIGGWLSDRIGPVRVLAATLAVVLVAAFTQSFTPSLAPVATIAFLAMAAALGAGSGAVFALVALLAPADKVGSVTGVVGAAGGLGGFVPPLVMGSLYGAYGSYALGLVLLAVVAAAALTFTGTGVRHAATRRTPAPQAH
ncbi:MFS transporter [Streptomyces sp. PRh5]|nr:MFS transporter [Streptomyces sp. PRh5]